MSAPAALRNSYQDFFFSTMLPAMEEVFDYELSMHPSRRNELFEIKSTDESIYQSTELHDLPLFSQVAEGEDFSLQRQKQGASKTLTPVKYGLGFSISEEMIADGKMNFVADGVRKLVKSARETQEVTAMNIFNNGFGSETTADGVAVFSTAHTLPGGATFRNKLSTDADLSVTSLKQAIQDFEQVFVGDSGIIYQPIPRALLVHSSNRMDAAELIKSSLLPNTADNNMNSIQDENLRLASSPHLTDTDAWYLLAEARDTGLRVIERSPLSQSADSVFINDSVRYKAKYREVVGAIHPVGIFGSQGA